MPYTAALMTQLSLTLRKYAPLGPLLLAGLACNESSSGSVADAAVTDAAADMSARTDGSDGPAAACASYTDLPARIETNLSVGPGCVRAGKTVIARGAVLTIAPGTTVYFSAGGHIDAGAWEAGALVAVGSATNPIRFTSIAASPQPGDWQCIYLGRQGVDSDLKHVTIEYGGALCTVTGSSDNLASVIIAGGIRGFANSTVTDSLTHAVKITNDAGARAFENNRFARNGKNGEPSLWIAANEIVRLGTGLQFDDADDYIFVDTTFSAKQSGTWARQPVPLRMQRLAINDGAEIRIAAGNKIQMNGGTIEVFQAALITEGTAESPVVFTSGNASPRKGDWGCLYFSSVRGSPSLKHTVIEYGGNGNGCSGANHKTAVSISGSDPVQFESVIIREIDGSGVRTTRDCASLMPWCSQIMFGPMVTPHIQCGSSASMMHTCP